MTADWERFHPNRSVGQHVLVWRDTTSSQDEAWTLLRGGAPHGTVVRALRQTQGRGRFARRWEGGDAEALLISVIVRPSLDVAAKLPIITTLAVRDAIRELTSATCGIKWPNDVLWDDRKIAGVLVETEVDTEGNVAGVVGIGLNLALDQAAHPDVAGIAASIADIAGNPVSGDTAEDEVMVALATRLNDAASDLRELVSSWRAALITLGHHVTVHQRDGALSGIAEDVDDAGRLLLRTADGSLHTLSEGDVSLSG